MVNIWQERFTRQTFNCVQQFISETKDVLQGFSLVFVNVLLKKAADPLAIGHVVEYCHADCHGELVVSWCNLVKEVLY